MKTLFSLASNLIYYKYSIVSTTLVRQVTEYFKKNHRTFLVVTTDNRVSGLIGREKLMQAVRDPEQWAIQADKPISELMDKNPLIFDVFGDTLELYRMIVSRPLETVYDDVVITKNNVFAGLVSVKQLMICMFNDLEHHLEKDRQWLDEMKKPIVATLFSHPTDSTAISGNTLEIQAVESKMVEPVLENTEPSDAEDDIQLQGSLENFSVLELLQVLLQGGKTGRLDVQRNVEDTPVSLVYVDRGKIVHAEDNGIGGKEALLKILKINEGKSLFRSGRRAAAITIDEEPMFLFMEACRLEDENSIGLHTETAAGI